MPARELSYFASQLRWLTTAGQDFCALGLAGIAEDDSGIDVGALKQLSNSFASYLLPSFLFVPDQVEVDCKTYKPDPVNEAMDAQSSACGILFRSFYYGLFSFHPHLLERYWFDYKELPEQEKLPGSQYVKNGHIKDGSGEYVTRIVTADDVGANNDNETLSVYKSLDN